MRYFSAFAARTRPPEGKLLRPAVGAEGDRLRALLAMTARAELSLDDIRAEVEGNLGMLSPEAFRYFLPALLTVASEHYDSLGNFVAELVGALTEPSRADVLEALDRAAQVPADIGLTPETLRQLRQQQLQWYDSGEPLATYQKRVGDLSAAEAQAILDFLVALRDAHEEDFPFNELQVAIDRHRAHHPGR